MGFRVEIVKETGKRDRLVLFFTKTPVPPEIRAERDMIRTLLHLDRNREDF